MGETTRLGRSVGMRVMMLPEAKEALEGLAARERRPVSDLVREALEGYLKANGVNVEVSVNRGGWRGGRKEE